LDLAPFPDSRSMAATGSVPTWAAPPSSRSQTPVTQSAATRTRSQPPFQRCSLAPRLS